MSGFTTWKIEPNGSGWTVRRHDSDEPDSHHDEKVVAIERAVEFATGDRPSQVLVHAKDGSITSAFHYNETRDEDPLLPEGSPPMAGSLLATYSESDFPEPDEGEGANPI